MPEALRRLGYPAERAQEILDAIDRTGSAERAAGLSRRHLPVFDTAVPSRPGGRALSPEAHLLMMAALQPFVSGAISKTVNLPAEATVEDVERIFVRAWRLGLKAVAVYRDRSKVTQPLTPSREKPSSRRRPGARGEEPAGIASNASDPCRDCGTGMVPSGTCLLCPNCGAATGCE